jgi:hypothetical protein
MQFCSVEKCTICSLIKGSADFLRKQAQRCEALSKRVFGSGVHDALEELSLELMDEARAVEKERTVPPAPIN